jgi:hypothetical protein
LEDFSGCHSGKVKVGKKEKLYEKYKKIIKIHIGLAYCDFVQFYI